MGTVCPEPGSDPEPGTRRRGTANVDTRAVRTFRVFVVTTAVVAIVLGGVGILWPRPTLVVLALLFGVDLVVAGVLRVASAAIGRGTHRVWRWVSIVGGVFVAAAGLVCLLDPAAPLVVLATLGGIGFVVEGVAALVGAVVGHPGSSRGPSAVSGALSILAGVAVLVAPGLALAAFVVLAGIVLVVVGIAALLLVPPRAAIRG
ncbi:DUF308 domain-containing protein [Curtobacterium sp. MCBD17_019]|nr:DUF308 domain-containing protein [Curtobacterium sp. MCBD17_028]PZE77155.1 DUF308 domain-containing protein [Curtobacterium sp. MCBD17_019]